MVVVQRVVCVAEVTAVGGTVAVVVAVVLADREVEVTRAAAALVVRVAAFEVAEVGLGVAGVAMAAAADLAHQERAA
jgi:hypothetical protein